MKTHAHVKMCTQIFIVAPTGNNPNALQWVINKQAMVHPCHGILLSNKNKWFTAIHKILDWYWGLDGCEETQAQKVNTVWFQVCKLLEMTEYTDGG